MHKNSEQAERRVGYNRQLQLSAENDKRRRHEIPHEIIQGTPVLTSWRVIEKSNVADRNTFSQGSKAKVPRLNLKR